MELVIAALVLSCLHSLVLSDYQGDALFALRNSLRVPNDLLKDWNQNQVNPCTWSNVYCDSTNNVISLSLSSMNFSGTLSPKIGVLKHLSTLCILSIKSILKGNGITGEIPEEFGNLSSLTSLDLDNNRLTGEIPSSLGNLKLLQFLTLSQNNLTGAIPESLTGIPNLINLQLDSNGFSGRIPENLFKIPKYNRSYALMISALNLIGLAYISFTGNDLNCDKSFPHPCESSSNDSGNSKKPKIGIIVGIVGGIIVLLLGGVLFFMCKGRHKGYKREVFVDVAGEVDRRIAFGQLKRYSWRELQLATDNFSEKNVLGQGGFGKVYKGVLGDNTKVAVKRLTDFESPGGDAAFQREVEMISVAVHRNLLRLIGFCTTPTERLLVYPFMQNLSVAYRLRDVRKTNVTTQVRGTMGHIAPEYLSTGKSSERTDVFGYGITLLELVTGQRAIDFSRLEEEDDVLLLDHVKKLEREKRLDAIVDHNLNRNYNIQEVETMIQVALLCTQASPEDRPAMSVVVRMLEGEGLAERWEEWQHVEVTRRQEYERLHRRFDWGEDSVYNQEAIELSGGR
ncbi:hypothetical protein JRO89_XS08G0001300 [Xanthoceras sorbifolium]|uniref:Protein kinase domain-containing protein n=1 Tax=Xanthoceras sorbifolium TaxID=99658 RepID=A0ABQ8HMW3_9ROSI|nr:hypothetical protein JRO89_XS08G0001300 [Xanthoceras sorbifolium]